MNSLLLFSNCLIVDPESPYFMEHKSILVHNGTITAIEDHIEHDSSMEILQEHCIFSPGLFCPFGNIPHSSAPWKESLSSGTGAAAAGGFTDIAIFSDEEDPIVRKEQIYYWKSSAGAAIHLLSGYFKDASSSQLSNFYELYKEGVIGFTSGRRSIENISAFKNALDYAAAGDFPLIDFPTQLSFHSGGMVHESATSVFLGLPGIPNVAEFMMVQRNIALAEYTQSKLHLSCISTKESVALLREAKHKGISITACVPVLNLLFTEEYLSDFDVTKKVLPPLRSKLDQQALIEGLKDGTIDGICSNHHPQDLESKRKEFQSAEFGTPTYEQTVAMAYNALEEHFELEDILTFFHTGNRSIYGLSAPKVAVGSSDHFSVFSLSETPTLVAQKNSIAAYPTEELHSAIRTVGVWIDKQWYPSNA